MARLLLRLVATPETSFLPLFFRMTPINLSALHAARVSVAPFVAMFLISGASACGGGEDDGASEGTGGSGGTGGGSGGSAGSGGSGAGNGGSSGSSAGSSGTSGNGAPSGEVCANDERAGSFSLRLSGGDRTLFSGAISDGVAPTGLNREIASEGACQLLGPLVCSTACASGTACAGDDMCAPLPMKQSAGAITVTGLLVPVEVMANGITGEYSKTILDPYPAFEPGAAIALSAAGATIPAFTLRGWGVPELETPLSTINVSSGSPVPLTWETAGVNTEHSEIFISFSVNVHGATTGWIECTVPDTGSFDLPAGLVSDLIDLGLSGFPRMTITRRSADSTALSAGDCVDFEVASQVTIELTVDGLVSCNDDTDCPEGQMCTPELACE